MRVAVAVGPLLAPLPLSLSPRFAFAFSLIESGHGVCKVQQRLPLPLTLQLRLTTTECGGGGCLDERRRALPPHTPIANVSVSAYTHARYELLPGAIH